MYYVEFANRHAAGVAGEDSDLPWTRYRPGFDSYQRAAVEALWLSLDDDSRYIYRIVEVNLGV